MIHIRFSRAAVAVAALIVLTGCGARTASPAFDGERAFDILRRQVDFGPRYAGVAGHRTMIAFLQSELGKVADDVTSQTIMSNIDDSRLEFRNIFGVFNPKASRFVLLCAHWDTRPTADQEVDPAKRKRPIPGANDGASGVAVLIELARTFHEKKPEVGVVMAFFDGEDFGLTPDQMFIGSREFAKNWKTVVCPGGREISYDYGVLIDMVGQKNLVIPKEKFSAQSAPKVVEKVWAAARRAGYADVFVDQEQYRIEDDHVPLIMAGIKCIDVIDFDYAPWHTLDDTVDKCSPKSLQAVGDVLSELIYSESAKGR